MAGKEKFELFDASWNAGNGAPDTVGTDEGRDKVDSFTCADEPGEITAGILRALRQGGPCTLVFAHYAGPDLRGHAAGWDVRPGSKYMKAVAVVGQELARLCDAIEEDAELRGRTAVVLTADHGGGAPFRGHNQPRARVDHAIPFLVWTGDDCGPSDLYALNELTRADPGTEQEEIDSSGLPPIRNGDAGNLVLGLLDLPPIPGSTIDARQDLRVR